jgi:hypothetical protein
MRAVAPPVSTATPAEVVGADVGVKVIPAAVVPPTVPYTRIRSPDASVTMPDAVLPEVSEAALPTFTQHNPAESPVEKHGALAADVVDVPPWVAMRYPTAAIAPITRPVTTVSGDTRFMKDGLRRRRTGSSGAGGRSGRGRRNLRRVRVGHCGVCSGRHRRTVVVLVQKVPPDPDGRRGHEASDDELRVRKGIGLVVACSANFHEVAPVGVDESEPMSELEAMPYGPFSVKVSACVDPRMGSGGSGGVGSPKMAGATARVSRYAPNATVSEAPAQSARSEVEMAMGRSLP